MIASHTDKYHSGTLLCSSSGRHWEGLSAEIWHHSAGMIVDKALQGDTEIAIDLVGHTETVVARQAGTTAERTVSEKGMVWMCPGGVVEDYIHLSSPVTKQLHIYLKPTLFSEVVLGQEVRADARNLLLYATGFRDPLLAGIGEAIAGELEAETSVGCMLIEVLSTALVLRLVQRHCGTDATLPNSLISNRGLDSRRLSRVLEYIETNIEVQFSISTLAGVACLSRFYFTRAFRISMGCTPQQYVSRRRLSRAQELLLRSESAVTQIAARLGFSNEANFSRAFRRLTGETPTYYRRSRSR